MPRVSLSWLREHVDIPADATIEEVSADLVRVGLEEEQILPPKVQGPLVAGKVLSIVTETASNGKDINYCRVDVGKYNDEPGSGKEPSELPSRGIICGAHNFQVGDTVVVSLPGAVLPGEFEIAARKTYGHISDGMICSERELGLGNDHSGIIVLDRKFPDQELPAPGTDMIPLLGLGEEVLEVNVTPDRGYCFAVRGIAREYHLATGATYRDLGKPEAVSEIPPTSTDPSRVFLAEVPAESTLEGRLACDRFVTRVVRNIDPKAPTPTWMVERLEAAGMRSLSLPVDITNYVMLDLGQPLHAYDLDYVKAPFVVRRAKVGEKFTTLDDVERTLSTEDILITDSPDGKAASRIVGLAGVMGGLDSEIRPDTTAVVIEGARFDRVSVARTARRHKLPSEASKRFERGVDADLAPVAVQRVVDLLVEYAGATPDPEGFDLNQAAPLSVIDFDPSEPSCLIGAEYTESQVKEILTNLGCKVSAGSAGRIQVEPPTWRPDLATVPDLVEEIARIDGYDRIPSLIPSAPGGHQLPVGKQVRQYAAHVLAGNGLVEVKSYPFIGDAHDRQLLPEADPRRQSVRLRNPLADDAPALRTTILDSLLEVASRNATRGMTSVAVFEVGAVTLAQVEAFSPILPVEQRPGEESLQKLIAGVPNQPWKAAGVMGGAHGAVSVLTPGRAWDWADAVESVRQVAAAVGVEVETCRAWLPEDASVRPGPPLPAATHDPAEVAPWHPGRAATIFVRKGKGYVVLGTAGELHPRVVREYGLPARSVAFEINLDELAALTLTEAIQVKPVSTYPLVREDFAVVVEESLPISNVAREIRRAAGECFESLHLFDVYTGEQIPDGQRSLAFALTLRAANRTLSSEEVTQIRAQIVQAIEKRLHGKLRA